MFEVSLHSLFKIKDACDDLSVYMINLSDIAAFGSNPAASFAAASCAANYTTNIVGVVRLSSDL